MAKPPKCEKPKGCDCQQRLDALGAEEALDDLRRDYKTSGREEGNVFLFLFCLCLFLFLFLFFVCCFLVVFFEKKEMPFWLRS